MMQVSIETLRKRAAWRLTLAASITSAILAPLVLGTVVLVMGESWSEGPPNGITVELLACALLAMVPAACLGGFAMYRGATGNETSTLGWSALGGVLFLGASLCCVGLQSLANTPVAHLPSVPTVVGGVLLATAFGSFVSAPTGFAFGLFFLIALSPLTSRLSSPSHVTPADALRRSAVMFLVASGVALMCAGAVQVHVAAFAHDHLALDANWLAFALFPVPLLLFAFVFELASRVETRAILRLRDAVLRDAHPEVHLSELAPNDDAIPLTEADRKGTNKRLVQRRNASAYRGGETFEMSVYVAQTS